VKPDGAGNKNEGMKKTFRAIHSRLQLFTRLNPSVHLDREIFLDILDKLRRLAEERG